jgi:hypothetical protein
MIYLDENQVRTIVQEAEKAGEFISIRCIRKGEGDPANGTEKGELHTLICTSKPPYKGAPSSRDRAAEDAANHVLTVWAVNRKTGTQVGAWRRINLAAVQEVRYKEEEYKVVHTR